MQNLPEPKAGEIWDVLLEPVVGREQGGRRPVLVISNDYFNEAPNGLHVIAPITSRNRNLIMHVPLPAAEGGLPRDSVIMCDQVKSASVYRFKRCKGAVTQVTLDRVREIVARIIDR